MNKIYKLEDVEIKFILCQFTLKELDIIERYNNLVGEAIKWRINQKNKNQ